jgi:hypothetical protein
MTEEAIMKWMRQQMAQGEFTDAASMAGQFLKEHNIHDVLDPTFQKVIDTGFKLADEIAASS